jgi:hypothetical protein
MPSQSASKSRWVHFLGRALFSVLMFCCITDAFSDDRYDVSRRRVEKIEPGTVVEKEAPKGWTYLLAKSRPRLGAGDVDKVPPMVANSASVIFSALVAKVERDPAGQGGFRLTRLGVGVGAKVGGKDIILSPQTQGRFGANLGLVGRVALERSYAHLDEALWVARSPTMGVFDGPGQMLLGGKHRSVVMRNALLIDEKTGRPDPLVWMIELDDEGRYKGVSGDIQFMRLNDQSDTVLHVDANEFALGLPTEMSFAMMRVPQGKKQIPFTDDLKRLAGQERLSKEMAAELETKLRDALRRAEAP